MNDLNRYIHKAGMAHEIILLDAFDERFTDEKERSFVPALESLKLDLERFSHREFIDYQRLLSASANAMYRLVRETGSLAEAI